MSTIRKLWRADLNRNTECGYRAGAGTGPGQGTFTATFYGLNPAGALAAAYSDSSDMWHGFVRAPDGTITTFDAEGAGTGAFQGTLPDSINPEGAITGWYVDANNVAHGFLRLSDGTIITFDAPGAGTGPGQGTFSIGNNPSGGSPDTMWTGAM